MKVAVSIPDNVFAQADQAANELNLSRSGLYSRALAELLRRRKDDAITAEMNAAVDALQPGHDDIEAVRSAARETFRRVEW